MKLQLSRMLLLLFAIGLFSTTIVGCKNKAKDADIKTAIEAALVDNPAAEGVIVDVKDGVATISGQLKDQASKDAITTIVTGVKGVKSVVNNATVAVAPPPPTISADDALTTAVTDALKAFPGVTATVKDGVISLSGKIAKADRQKLMMVLQSLKPKKVEVADLTNN